MTSTVGASPYEEWRSKPADIDEPYIHCQSMRVIIIAEISPSLVFEDHERTNEPNGRQPMRPIVLTLKCSPHGRDRCGPARRSAPRLGSTETVLSL